MIHQMHRGVEATGRAGEIMPLSKNVNDSAKSRQWRMSGGSQLAVDNDRSHVPHVIGLLRNVYVPVQAHFTGRPTDV